MYKSIVVCMLILIELFILNSATMAKMHDQKQVWHDMEEYFSKSLSEMGIVGGSMMLFHKGKLPETFYYGLADLDAQRPVNEQTIYHYASITKTFTAIAIMQLRDRQLLNLDDSVIDYIPELKAVHNPYGEMKNITIRHLISHSAGFRGPTWPWGGDKSWHPYEPTQWEQLVAMMPYTEILFKPGSRYSYSNFGIVFLGRIIELISGDDYEVYIDKNILKPLKMYHSYFDRTPYHLLSQRSNNYFIKNGKMTTNGFDFDTGITVSNGGLNAPFGDMVKYLKFLVGNKNGEFTILKRSSLEEMWQIEHPVAEDSTLREWIALGFFVVDIGNQRFIGHTGEQRGFMSFFYIHPKSQTGCLVAFNTVVNTYNTDKELIEPNTISLRSNLRQKMLEDVFPHFIDN